MPSKELNNILLHALLNGWYNQDYLQGFEFNMDTYNMTTNLFEFMETSKQIYK